MRRGALTGAAGVEGHVRSVAIDRPVRAPGHPGEPPVAVQHHDAVVRRPGVRWTETAGAVLPGGPAQELRGAVIDRRIIKDVDDPCRRGLGQAGPRSAQDAAGELAESALLGVSGRSDQERAYDRADRDQGFEEGLHQISSMEDSCVGSLRWAQKYDSLCTIPLNTPKTLDVKANQAVHTDLPAAKAGRS